jgi:release factor glutamine methyltransferase
VHAAENAVEAFVWAKENFAAHAPQARLAFIDLADAFPELDGTVAVLVSNPPYVPDAAIPRDPEVRHWDPPSALRRRTAWTSSASSRTSGCACCVRAEHS